jgi:hypothetical protein
MTAQVAITAKDIEQSVWKQACFGELEGLKLLVEVNKIKSNYKQ